MKQWKMRDGTMIPIRDMTNNHLDNAIAMLERNAPRRRAGLYFSIAAYAEDKEGTMASDAASEEAEALLDNMDSTDPSDVFPIYDDLVQERERRSAP